MTAALTTRLSHFQSLHTTQLVRVIGDNHDEAESAIARFVVTLGELNARNPWEELGALNGVDWLTTAQGIAVSTARGYLQVARRLQQLPQVAEEYLAGGITFTAMKVLVRYLTEDNWEELVDMARSMTCEELRRALSGRDRVDDEKTQQEYFRIRVEEDTGAVTINGRLSAAHGAALMAALKIAELAFLRDVEELQLADASDDELDQLIDDTRANPPEEAVPGEEVEPEDKPYHRPWQPFPDADDKPSVTRYGRPTGRTALVALLTMINMVRDRPKSSVRAPGAEVHAMITVDGLAQLPNQPGASNNELVDLIINSDVRYHLLDRDGNTAQLSTSARFVNAAQELALLTRWGHQCAAPGCTNSRYLEFHHITPVHQGGNTTMDNLVVLCAGCHSLVTDGLIAMWVDDIDAKKLHFLFPHGRHFVSTGRDLPRRACEGVHDVREDFLSFDD